MQTTSTAWNALAASPYRPLNTGVLISFDKTVASWVNYFTINDTNSAVTVTDSPGTMADDSTVGAVTWTNPNNSKVSDNTYTTATMTGASGVIDSYSESNRNTDTYLYSPGAYQAIGQSFTGSASTIASTQFYLKRVGALTGNVVSRLYAHTGSFGNSSKPTGTPLATSDTVAASGLSTSQALVSFTFSTTYQMQAGVNYVTTVEWTGAGDSSHYIAVGVDTTSPTHGGNLVDSTDLSYWGYSAGQDLCFYVNGSTNAGSHYLKASNFGFTLPAGASVNGIMVEVEQKSTPTSYESEIKIVKSGVIGTVNKSTGATIPSSDTYVQYGGTNELWGLSWAYGDINSSTFGAVFSATGQGTISIDHMRITVYYTGSAPTSSSASIIGGLDVIRGDSSSTNVSFFDKYKYVDYTPQIKNWSVQRDVGQFPFGLIMAQADIELDNSSNLFTPGHDGTIGQYILPGRPLKVSVGLGNDSLQQFMGYTGQPEISMSQRSMTLHAYDVMDYLNNYKFTSTSGTTYSGTLSNMTTSGILGYYLGRLGFNANQMKIDYSLQDPLYFVNVTDRKFGEVLQDLMYAEQGMLFADENGGINFWNRQHFTTMSGLGARFNLNFDNTISIDYATAPVINDVTVSSQPRQIVANPVSVYSNTTSQTIPGNSSLTLFLDFTDANGQVYVSNVITPTYQASPVGTSYYTLDTTVVGSPNSYISVSSTYSFGTTYKIVFANSNSTNISLTDLNIFGNPASVVDNISQNYLDQASIDAYGRNPSNNGETFVITNNYIQNNSSALSLGYDIVTRYSQPNRHYDVEIFSNPALQIGDYGTIDPDGSGNLRNTWITAKTDKLNPGGDLTQQLKLEEKTIIHYFTINVSTISGQDRIAP